MYCKKIEILFLQYPEYIEPRIRNEHVRESEFGCAYARD